MLKLIPLAGALVLSGCMAPAAPPMDGLGQMPRPPWVPLVVVKVVGATGSTGGS